MRLFGRRRSTKDEHNEAEPPPDDVQRTSGDTQVKSEHFDGEDLMIVDRSEDLPDPAPVEAKPPSQMLQDTVSSSMNVHATSSLRKAKRRNDDDVSETANPDTNKKRRSPPTSPDPSAASDEEPDPDSPVEINAPTDVHDTEEDHEQPPAKLVKDLETRAITVGQLIQEVKGIYAGLVMVEKKCIEIVTQQTQNPTKLSKEQWQALIALHRTLLNEHHDFFSASHHPVTKGHELRELAQRYAMPARMWRHGIHAFLELLRHRLPESLEHMLSFVYLAYSIMALLMETVPDFLETWIECLGDLARYRMAIEEADLREREVWSATARTWYNQAADLSINTGRIQHHLAVLARPNILQQLFLYSKALVAAVPFKNAGESILLLFNPLLEQNSTSNSRYQPAEFNFVCAAAILFKRKAVVEFEMYETQFFNNLEPHIARSGAKFKIQGPEIAGSIWAMMLDFGNELNPLWKMLSRHQEQMKEAYCKKHKIAMDKLPKDFVVQELDLLEPVRSEYWNCLQTSQEATEHIPLPTLAKESNFTESEQISSYVGQLMFRTTSDVAGRIGNKNVVPYMYMMLAYLYALTWVPKAILYIERCVPWEKIVEFLNTVGRSGVSYDNVEGPEFPKSFGSGGKRQLPEDFVMRGLMAMTYYYPPSFFAKDELVDEDERLLEQASHQAPRVERCLWAAIRLSETSNRWLSYDQTTKLFSTTEFSRSFKLQ